MKLKPLHNRSKAFTLIELMIVVAIIGILASIAVPKFASLIKQSKEGASKGGLGSIRSALSVYYSDMEGQFPEQLIAMTVNGKYFSAIPYARTPDYHTDTTTESDGCGACPSACCALTDPGGWAYDNTATEQWFGTALVNCSHTDSKGSIWSSY